MPKKIQLTATLPDGTIATRTTARAYTHVSCGRRSYDEAMRRATKDWGDTDRSNFAYHTAYLDGTSRFLVQPSYKSKEAHEADCARQIEASREELNGCTTVEDYRAMKRAAREEAVQAAHLRGDFDKWRVIGWASREDLAHKAASSENRNGYYAETRVVPVNS